MPGKTFYDMLLWCKQWVNKTNNHMDRRRGPLIPLSQVRPRLNWEGARVFLGFHMLIMNELSVVGSLLMGEHDNLVVKNFVNQMQGLHKVETSLLAICIAYGLP